MNKFALIGVAGYIAPRRPEAVAYGGSSVEILCTEIKRPEIARLSIISPSLSGG